MVSVLFVDLVGFTSRSERLDPEDVRAFLMLPYYESARAEIERRGGTVEKFIGDAVMGLFGAPTAYGDDAERAVRAALAVRDWAADEDFQVRVAVNTGEALVALDAVAAMGEPLVAGDVVNTAARLQSGAPVGSVIVGAEACSATRTAVEYRRGPPVVGKGKSEPIPAWLAVEAVTGAGERVLSRVPIVGRERELATLAGIWERVTGERRPPARHRRRAGRHRQVATRARVLAARVLARRPRPRGRSTPYGAGMPYGAFGHHVKQLAHVFDSDGQEKLRATLVELVGSEREGAEHAHHLALLLGLGDDGTVGDRETLFFSARVLLETVAARGAARYSCSRTSTGRTRACSTSSRRSRPASATCRPAARLTRPGALGRPGWGGGLPAYTALQLERLPDDASRRLAEGLLRRGARARAGRGGREPAEGNTSSSRARRSARRADDRRRG